MADCAHIPYSGLVLWAFCVWLIGIRVEAAAEPPGKSDKELMHLNLPHAGISLDHPNIFVKSASAASPVLLALKPRGKSLWPTINIIQAPGSYRFDRSLKAQAQEIIHSYKLAGFTDAHCLAITSSAAQGAFTQATIAYNQGGVPFLSEVAVFSGPDRHYIITLTGPKNLSSKYYKVLLSPMTASFHAPGLVQPSASHTQDSFNRLISAAALWLSLSL